MRHIRPATQMDTAAIADLARAFADFHHELEPLHKTGLEYSEWEKMVSEWLSDTDTRMFVAEDNGHVVGYIRASADNAPLYSREKKIGKINDVYVVPAARKRGVLTALFNEELSWFRTKHVSSVELNVLVRNIDAIASWRALGFKEYRLRMRRGV